MPHGSTFVPWSSAAAQRAHWRRCYATINAELGTLPFNYGRWQENKAAREVSIRWQEGPPWTLKREGDALSLGGKKLLKFRPLDGLKLDGTFVHRSLLGTNIALVLRRDEHFDAGGLLEEMNCPATDGRPTLSGSGTYEVRKWTLILRFSSGKVTLLPISVPNEEDLQRVGKFRSEAPTTSSGHDRCTKRRERGTRRTA